jgi:beta-N-acetylhexosaminidase
MVLLCNRPDLADELLEKFEWKMSAQSIVRLANMHGLRHPESMQHLQHNTEFAVALDHLATVGKPETKSASDLFA